ncbi:MAG: DUF3093 domain-containing protein [Actinomycetota bacterium]|nr:DUF3093 domain-containing protein [Actinomycetota bacterium]
MTVPPERPVPLYRERVWPAAWVLLSLALVLPASLLVFLPINPIVGVVTGVVLYAGLVVLLLIGSPTLEVTERGFTAGRATLPARHIGEAVGFSREDATRERGPALDARAWLLIRGWVGPVVRVEVADDRDPVPYWLVSTRRPDELVSALERVRPRTPGR